MHDWWCEQGDHATKHGPCRKHQTLLDAEEAKTPPEEIRKLMMAIDEEIPNEIGTVQLKEMHDAWCGRPEALEAAPDSPLKNYCLGWEDHKAKMEL